MNPDVTPPTSRNPSPAAVGRNPKLARDAPSATVTDPIAYIVVGSTVASTLVQAVSANSVPRVALTGTEMSCGATDDFGYVG